ncbi:MAG: NAD-dependent epimerase/dehydratase family protein [Thermoguttaceae bacterium]
MLSLVTGGSGFLGGAIVRALVERGDSVRVLVRRDVPELSALGAQVVYGDITDRDAVGAACANCDVVYHTAAIAGITCRWKPFYETNTLGTYNVIDGCLRHGVQKLVYTSSPSVTFDGSPQRNVNETVPYPTRWLAHYPHSKALAERAVLEVHGEKLATCALRPHLIWGTGDRHLIPRLLDRARCGRLMRVGDGKNLIDTIYIDNAASAHLKAADALTQNSVVGGKAYFLSQGEPVVCWDWIDELLALHNLPPVRRRISYRFAWTIGAMLESFYTVSRPSREPPMTRFLAAQLALDHYFDITAARKDFGYAPLISTAEGMRRLVQQSEREA